MKCLLVLALTLVACVGPYEVNSPRVAPPPISHSSDYDTPFCEGCLGFDAPEFYNRWWQQVERCSGFTGKLNLVRWYLAPKPFLRVPGNPNFLLGMYLPDRNIIILGLFRETDSTIVGHEMLHALIDQNGARSDSVMHPPVEKQRCGELIGPWQ